MKRLVKPLIAAAALAMLLLTGPVAVAGPLEDAKAAGQVGEQANGYLGVVSGNAPANVRRLVDEINLKRREVYRATAEKAGTSLNDVEAISGKKLVERSASGEYIRLPDGRWVQQR